MRTKLRSVEQRRMFYEKMCRSIVCIYPEKNAHLIGGGVFVTVGSQQLVLTAAHFVHTKKDVFVVCFDNNAYVADIVHCDVPHDVALLDIRHGPNGGFECAQLFGGSDELVRAAEICFIGHPGRQIFAYNVGQISCVERECRDIYARFGDCLTELDSDCFIDDFRVLDESLKLIQARNMHGGGRFGGTGAPFLDINGNIIGLYSFTYREEDYAIHFAEVRASIARFLCKGKGKTVGMFTHRLWKGLGAQI